jgi:uncharacterized membrane protein
MKLRLTVILVAVLLLLTPLKIAHCQNYIQYKIQVNSDDSASCTVTQVSDINASVDTWNGFQQRILTLIDAAKNATHREMAVDPNSLQVEITINQSKTTEYTFVWQNFSTTENGNIVFGDVFRVTEFFSQLYGDGVLQVTYPLNYTIKSVAPPPNKQDDAQQMLEWFRTRDFINGKPNVTLTSKSPNKNSIDFQQGAIAATVLAVAIGGSLAVFFAIKRRKRREPEISKVPMFKDMSSVESEEEKVLKVVRSSGGTINQSIIAEQCKFSKAKTSQLLSALEQKGVVRRYKKGRDKIVILAHSTET